MMYVWLCITAAPEEITVAIYCLPRARHWGEPNACIISSLQQPWEMLLFPHFTDDKNGVWNV